MSDYPALVELLPHRGPMVLLDALTRWEKGAAECSARIAEGGRFVRDGVMESVVTIEHMAQAVAACLGYEALLGGGAPRAGMILAVKTFRAHGEALHVGDALRVSVRMQRGGDELSQFEGKVYRNDALFSEALLSIYHSETLPSAASA